MAERIHATAHARATTNGGHLTIAATAARPRTTWTTGMRRPELAPAPTHHAPPITPAKPTPGSSVDRG